MIANFQFKAGMGGHFFLRLLIYRWGIGSFPKANSYWNEYHFPYFYWENEDFYRLQIELPYGEEWFDWETNQLSYYNPTILEKYLETFEIPNKKRMFMLDHAVWPYLNDTFLKVKGIECPNVSITTKKYDTALFCRKLNHIKSNCKRFYNIQDDKNKNLREQETWVAEGPDLTEVLNNHNKFYLNTPGLIRSLEIENTWADIILDYDELVNGNIDSFKQLDEHYYLYPNIADTKIIVIQEIDINKACPKSG